MRIYTKKGDSGETSLLFGGRVSKADPRCEAYGTIDQAVSAMGLARALSKELRVQEMLLHVQRDMFMVGAELATDPTNYRLLDENFGTVTSDMVDNLETYIDELAAEINLPQAFIVPGGSVGSGAIDLARSMLRSGERRVVDIHQAGLLSNPEVLRYLNRLSDLLFMMARYEDRDVPFELTTSEQV